MESIVFLFIGLIIGGSLGYLLVKVILQKNFVPLQDLNNANEIIDRLKLEIASRIPGVEIQEKFVSKELFNAVDLNLQTVNDKLTQANATILRLTAESEQKFSRSDIDQNYVSKKSFDIIEKALEEAKTSLSISSNEISKLNNELTELRKNEEFLNEKLTTFKGELEKLYAQSQEQFQNIAATVLEDKKKMFVDENKRELGSILDPLNANLKDFREKVEATRKEDIHDLTSLKKEIESLQKLNNQLSDDAKNLASALKSEVKMQGNWGEDRLNTIFEIEGLQRYIDYTREGVFRDEEKEKDRKPDFILRLPEGKCIVIDSKVSLTAYTKYFNASSKEEKAEFLKQHIKSVTEHIKLLSDKNYQMLTGLKTPDYVFMFMPVESALTLALNHDPQIFDNALKKKIVLITPTTLVATLKVVKILWQKENQVKNVEEIFKQCGALYDKFVTFLVNLKAIDTALSNATKAHKDALEDLSTGTRKGNTIIGRLERIKTLEAKVTKQIPVEYLREIDLLPDDKENNDVIDDSDDSLLIPGETASDE